MVVSAVMITGRIRASPAWRMASKWSLAVGVYGKGWQANRYADIWQQADYAARILSVQLPVLPEDVPTDEVLSSATTSMLPSSGPMRTSAAANME